MTGSTDQSTRIVIQNATDRPRIVWVEPLGEDYTLRPEEKLDLIVRGKPGAIWFHLVEHSESSQVWIEGDYLDFDAICDGLKVTCGHQRQIALDAGLSL